MYGPEILLVMFVLRLVVPVGLMLWLGETVRRRQFNRLHGI